MYTYRYISNTCEYISSMWTLWAANKTVYRYATIIIHAVKDWYLVQPASNFAICTIYICTYTRVCTVPHTYCRRYVQLHLHVWANYHVYPLDAYPCTRVFRTISSHNIYRYNVQYSRVPANPFVEAVMGVFIITIQMFHANKWMTGDFIRSKWDTRTSTSFYLKQAQETWRFKSRMVSNLSLMSIFTIHGLPSKE